MNIPEPFVLKRCKCCLDKWAKVGDYCGHCAQSMIPYHPLRKCANWGCDKPVNHGFIKRIYCSDECCHEMDKLVYRAILEWNKKYYGRCEGEDCIRYAVYGGLCGYCYRDYVSKNPRTRGPRYCLNDNIYLGPGKPGRLFCSNGRCAHEHWMKVSKRK